MFLKTKKGFVFIIIVLLSYILTGCRDNCSQVVDDDRRYYDSDIELGAFKINALPDSIRSYGNGGGLFILYWQSTDDVYTDVELSVNCPDELHYKITNNRMTINERVSEISILPDSAIKAGIYKIYVLAKHSKNIDTISLKVDVVVYPNWRSRNYEVMAIFINWIRKSYSFLDLKVEDNWYGYFMNANYVGEGRWCYFNEKWMMKIYSSVTPTGTFHMLLRRRNEIDPILAAEEELNGIIHSIPITEFYKPY